jgi:hypothetical protein
MVTDGSMIAVGGNIQVQGGVSAEVSKDDR